jgi:hypothetical protein
METSGPATPVAALPYYYKRTTKIPQLCHGLIGAKRAATVRARALRRAEETPVRAEAVGLEKHVIKERGGHQDRWGQKLIYLSFSKKKMLPKIWFILRPVRYKS